MNIPLKQWSGAGATENLQKIIEKFNETSTKQTREMIVLTRVIVFLTCVMLFAVGYQIYLSVYENKIDKSVADKKSHSLELSGMFNVNKIISHSAPENDNTETAISLYINGSTGHVKNIICRFPPGTEFGEKTSLRVSVNGVATQYAMNEKGYYCLVIN